MYIRSSFRNNGSTFASSVFTVTLHNIATTNDGNQLYYANISQKKAVMAILMPGK